MPVLHTYRAYPHQEGRFFETCAQDISCCLVDETENRVVAYVAFGEIETSEEFGNGCELLEFGYDKKINEGLFDMLFGEAEDILKSKGCNYIFFPMNAAFDICSIISFFGNHKTDDGVVRIYIG